MNEITQVAESELASTIGENTEVAWIAPAEMSYEQWEAIGHTMQQVNRSLNWWLGDWLAFGDREYGQKYAQAVEATDSSVESLRKYKGVAERVDRSVRSSVLSWTHHALVAYLPQVEHGPLLELAARYDLSTRSLKSIVELPDGLRAELIAKTTVDDLKRDEFFALIEELSEIAVRPVLRPAVVQPVESSEEDEDVFESEPLGEASTGEIVEHQASLFDSEYNPFEEQDETYGDNLLSAYWDSVGVPVEEITYNSVTWNGAVVRAEIDEDGEPILAWEISLS